MATAKAIMLAPKADAAPVEAGAPVASEEGCGVVYVGMVVLVPLVMTPVAHVPFPLHVVLGQLVVVLAYALISLLEVGASVIAGELAAAEELKGQKPAMKVLSFSRSAASGQAASTAGVSWAARSGFEHRQAGSMPGQPEAARAWGRPLRAQSGRSAMPAGRAWGVAVARAKVSAREAVVEKCILTGVAQEEIASERGQEQQG